MMLCVFQFTLTMYVVMKVNLVSTQAYIGNNFIISSSKNDFSFTSITILKQLQISLRSQLAEINNFTSNFNYS